MEKLVRMPFTRACLLGSGKVVTQANPFIFTNSYRFFARRGFKYPKGAMGKESSAAANSGFPKHKELFTEGYFNGEPTYED